MDIKLLKDIGLTEGETKVYLTLIRLGETKTGQLAKEANISSSKVYKVLDKLMNKGLAGHIIKGKIKYFQAMPPKTILDYMKKKQVELDNKIEQVKHLIPTLEVERKKSKSKTRATLFEGFKAIFNIYRNVIEELKAGEEYYVIGAYYTKYHPEVMDFFYNYHKDRAKKRIKVNMLVNYEAKIELVPTTKICSSIRFLPQYFINKMMILFYKKKVFFFFMTEEPVGVMLESQEAVDSLKSYFNVLWKIAKP